MGAVMADGNHNSNGRRQWRQRWAIATATAMAKATATSATATGYDDGDGNGNGHGKGNHYKGKVATSCGRQCAVLLERRYLASTPMDKKESACVMGMTLLRVFAPLQGGGFLTAHHGLFFVYFLQLLFSLLNNPLFAPPASFRRSRTLSAD
jgi:hypothetical protein